MRVLENGFVPILDPAVAAVELWPLVKGEDYAFDDASRGNPDAFRAVLVDERSRSFLHEGGALVTFRDVIPGHSCSFHHIVWNKEILLIGLVRDMKALLAAVFECEKLHRMTGYVADDGENIYAVRLASLLGFEYEGTYKQAILSRGSWHDLRHYGLLAEKLKGDACR